MSERAIVNIGLWKQWRQADEEVRRITAQSMAQIGRPSAEVLGLRCRQHAIASRKRASILKRLDHVTKAETPERDRHVAS